MSLIDNGDGTFTLTEDAAGTVTGGGYTPFYAAWKNSPDETTPIDAEALQHYDDAIGTAQQTANDAQTAAVGAQAYSDAKTLTGTTAVKTADFTAQVSLLHPVDATAGPITATLPSATGNAGAPIAVIKTDQAANLVTVTGTINGTAASTYHLNTNEGVELLSDGAGSWWLVSSQGADLSGLASQAALDTTNANVTALTTTVNGVSSQQTQLMGTAATIDELTVSTFPQGEWAPAGGGWQQTVSNSHQRTFFVAPFPCRVVACELMADFAAIPADPNNLMTFSLRRFDNTAASHTIVSKTTNDEALTTRIAWDLDSSVWDTGNATFAKGDGLSFNFGFSGTAELQYPVAVTCRIVPT